MRTVSDNSISINGLLNKVDYKIEKLKRESDILDQNLLHYNKEINTCNNIIEKNNKSLNKIDRNSENYKKNDTSKILNDLNTANNSFNRTQSRKQEVMNELARLHAERKSLIMSTPEKQTYEPLHSKKSPLRRSAKFSPPSRSMVTKMPQSIKSLVNPTVGGKRSRTLKRTKKQTMKKQKC